MENSTNQVPASGKEKILEKISLAKTAGSGFGYRFSEIELLGIFGKNGNSDSIKEIVSICRNEFGEDFHLVMPPSFVFSDFPVKRDFVSKIIVEMVWNKIDEKKKSGIVLELTNEEVYRYFGFGDGKNLPVELMLFGSDIDTMNPEEKFIRHASSGDVLYSTSEFNSVYKLFTYSGLCPKTIETAYKKVCDAREGNLVRFSSSEISYMEASDLFSHRTKTFSDTETVYSMEEYFGIMPLSLVKETSPDFDIDSSIKYFLKLTYSGVCCVKFAPYIVRCDKSYIKQNVQEYGSKVIEELVGFVQKSDENEINMANLAKGLMIKAGVPDLEILPSNNSENGQEMLMIRPKVFADVEFMKTLFSASNSAEENEAIITLIMRFSPEFCADKSAVSYAIGFTLKAYDMASERILPDNIIVLSMIKKLEDEIRAGRKINISKKFIAFAESIACDEDYRLIIKALEEFSNIDYDDDTKNKLLMKIDQILLKK